MSRGHYKTSSMKQREKNAARETDKLSKMSDSFPTVKPVEEQNTHGGLGKALRMFQGFNPKK